jgi:hypothetical protein
VDAEILIILCAKSDCKNICWAIKIAPELCLKVFTGPGQNVSVYQLLGSCSFVSCCSE